MEYSKDIIFNIKYNDVNNIKNRTSKIRERLCKVKVYKMFIAISIICFLLIGLDMALIFSFADMLQNSMI